MIEMRATWGAVVYYSGLALSNANSISGGNASSNLLAFMNTNAASSNLMVGYGADGTAPSYNVVAGIGQFTPSGYAIPGISYSSTHLKFFNNRTQLNQYATTPGYSPYVILGFFTGAQLPNTNITDVSIDWVLARKYVTPEPSGTVQAEEVGPYSGL